MAPMRSGVFIGAVFLGIRQQAEGGCVDDWDQKLRFDSNRFQIKGLRLINVCRNSCYDRERDSRLLCI